MQLAAFIVPVLLPLSYPLLAGGQTSAAIDTVLFVCEHGAVKSVVAAAIFNKLAAERGLRFRAISRGTEPDPAVPTPVREGLKGEGLIVDPMFSPTRVAPSDTARAKRVIVFDIVAPSGSTQAATVRWDDLPAFSDGYGPASAAIRARVEQLLRELQAGK